MKWKTDAACSSIDDDSFAFRCTGDRRPGFAMPAGGWLIDGKSNAGGGVRIATRQTRDCVSKPQNDVGYKWPDLPAGVKFDPSDLQLLDHLAAKCGVTDETPHKLIDEFIPTVDEDSGICYKHPKDLPGAKEDGSSIHFFHKTAKAYASGKRKRWKIKSAGDVEAVRWHKTGKTKTVVDVNGVPKGRKKIMVLYKCSSKGSKPEKSNWVMHQYHLGTEEHEQEGQYVVSRICYQQQKKPKKKNGIVDEQPRMAMNRYGPNTPNASTPSPPRLGSSFLCGDVCDQDMKPEASKLASALHPEAACSANPTGEPQPVHPDPIGTDGSFSYNQTCNSSNLEYDSLPDFPNPEIPLFGSQDSIFDWLDNFGRESR